VLLRRSAQANIEYALAVAGVARPERAERAQAALARARLTHLAGSPARVLSGGEQQLLSIARALATAPEILILDEPTSNLDPAATKAIEALLGVVRSEGTRIVLITHDLGQARRLADEVAFLHHGRMIERTDREGFSPAPRAAQALPARRDRPLGHSRVLGWPGHSWLLQLGAGVVERSAPVDEQEMGRMMFRPERSFDARAA
jgi:tungstate transport system ATP-binding protein